MENRTTFNLNRRVFDWKNKLSSNPNITADNAEELESHLWDEMTQLQNAGLNEEEAFIIANKRIGSLNDIASEFAKVNKSLSFSNRLLPYLRGVLAFIALIVTSRCLLYVLIFISNKTGNLQHLIDLGYHKISIFLTLVFLIIASLYFLLENKLPQIRNLTKTPSLVALIIINHLIFFKIISDLILEIEPVEISKINPSFDLFSAYLICILMVFSCIVQYSIKRKTKLVVSS